MYALPKGVFLYIISFLALFISYMPYDLGVFGIVRIDFLMIVLFYWMSQREDTCPASYILFLGVIIDVLSNMTLGSHTIAYLIMHFIIIYASKQKILGTVFGWYISMIISIVAAYSFIWLSLIIKDSSYIRDYSYAYSALLTIGAFPIIIFVFKKLLRAR